MLQVVYALTGNDKAPPILEGQLDDFISRVHGMLEEVVWEGSLRGLPGARSVAAAYEPLDDVARATMFLTPACYEAICVAWRTRTPEALDQLADFFERRPMGNRPSEEVGDGPDMSTTVRLADTVVLDLDSPHATRIDPTSPVFFMQPEPWTSTEVKHLVGKLRNAYGEIASTVPSFARLIRTYTRRVYVRKVGELPPSSEQVDTQLGAIRMRNAHSDLYPHGQLVDDFIHESVHNFLGTYEVLNFPFIPAGAAYDTTVRPVSPWSMRPIQVLPYVHAVFVYFAMLHYADRRLGMPGLDDAERRSLLRRRNRYASGFLMPDKLSANAAEIAQVDPRALAAIDSMQRIVQAKFGDHAVVAQDQQALAA